MKRIIYPTLVVLLALGACQEEKDENLTQEEAHVVIQNMSQDVESDVIDMVESEGVQAVLDMMDYLSFEESVDVLARKQNPIDISKITNSVKSIGKAFSPSGRINEDPIEEEEFIYEDHLGIYDWSVEADDFVLTDQDVDYIELKFPAKEATSNNASLFIYALSETEGEASKVDAALKVDGELLASLKLEAEITGNDIGDKLDMDLFLKPFTYVVKIDDTASKASSVEFKISRGSDVVAHLDIDVTYETILKIEPTEIAGSVGYGEIEIKGSVDFAGAKASEGENINDFIHVKLYHDGDFVGDLELVITTGSADDDDNVDVFVVYSDGTSESLVDLLEPTFDELEDVILEMEGM